MHLVALDAMIGVVGAMCVFDNTCIPHMAHREVFDATEHSRCYVGQLAATILFNCSRGNALIVVVGKEAWEQLIDDWLAGLVHG